MYRCLIFKKRMLQSCRNTIDIHKTLMYVYYVHVNHPYWGDGNIVIPHRKCWGMHLRLC